ncbi:MAG: bifunctional oligoribonuclease/PAP phosphatase NrnA [Candidatus Omnitrophica bacterium]|nr:bifunctional oligoribonuclease/PAP phosphatase NrnA [Candidatus Omnitrophota bacterium]MDE2009808.1 bifunctional oligoribonuclease/PAP phosphatase NrnA [Candidatus Omnitrophota bacterium]MDE2215395.1 bifunctional oligoribonuclease/PAP phosphatase NrnA [Candidatus Omnitrophota bacterium]MDE2231507.1 bifunctional oligoribonuclease/PAP phosphatase NrnA [Candidatus Omnitrophota bacterium]
MNSYKDVLNIIRLHERFLVTTHHNPDADAVASALSLGLYLKSLGKKVHVLNEDACPQWLKFLPATAMFKKASCVRRADHDAVIILDCGDLQRVGPEVKEFMREGRPVVVIDHHVTNERFGDVNVVKPKASSTCELIFDLFKEAKYPLNRNVAILLYAGIMTDTGSFRFENTTAYCHAVAEELLAFKFSASRMYDRLYTGIPVGDMKKFTDTIHEARLLDNNRVFCVALSRKTVDGFSKSFDLKEKLFSFLRSIEGIEVAVILTELNPQEVRVNLRSQNHFDVARLAQDFDGGGHQKAAGCKICGSLQQAQKIIAKAIHERLKEI